MHRHPRNMLQHNPTPFRGTKATVENIGGTPSYLFLKSTNEKTQFFWTVRLLNILANFFTMLQQLKIMPQTFYGTFRTMYKHAVKIKGTPSYLLLKRTNEKSNFF